MCVQAVLRGLDMEQALWGIKLWSLPFPIPSLSLCLAIEPVTMMTSCVILACSQGCRDGLTDGEADRMPHRGHCVATDIWGPPLAKLSIGHTVLGSSGLTVGGLGWAACGSQPYTALGHR